MYVKLGRRKRKKSQQKGIEREIVRSRDLTLEIDKR